ncbi:hypothetical protein [Bartonella sp. 220B]|uniref:hypothetical protein n=1 Tax=Bartonella sp. 220B TaxID=2967260 RepID=UPI003FA43731
MAYSYTIGFHCEMSLGALRNVSLKNRELATQWCFVLREGCDFMKEYDKQKREKTHNLHYLKDIAIDALESRKVALKADDKGGN